MNRWTWARTLTHSGISVSVFLTFLFITTTAYALTITNQSPAWVFVPGSITSTGGIWGLPANLTSIGCGTENETTCEPTGTFVLDKPINNAASYKTIIDQTGSISDYILFSDNGPGGNGQILFFSDPNNNPSLTGFANAGTACTESASGCVGSFTLTLSDSSILTLSVASDAEAVFDPFGFGFDTSDQIKFACAGNCTLVNNVPEPTSLALLGSALFGLGLLRRRRNRA